MDVRPAPHALYDHSHTTGQTHFRPPLQSRLNAAPRPPAPTLDALEIPTRHAAALHPAAGPVPEALPPQLAAAVDRSLLRRTLWGIAKGALQLAGYSTAQAAGEDILDHYLVIREKLRDLNEGSRGEEQFFRCAMPISRRLSDLQELRRYLHSNIGILLVEDGALRQTMIDRIDAITGNASKQMHFEYKLAKRYWRAEFRAKVDGVRKAVMPHSALEREIAKLNAFVDDSLLHDPEEQLALKKKTAKLGEMAGLRLGE